MIRGFLITRGLGCKGLLVTRGLGKCRVVIIPPDERPRQLTNIGRGRSSRHREREKEYEIECTFLYVRLVKVNGYELPFPLEDGIRVDCRKDDSIKVVSTLPKVKRRTRRILIKARYVRDPDF